jgi:multiple sugar transport system permease protein
VSKLRKLLDRESVIGYVFLVPSFVFLIAILAYPLALGIRMAFYDKSLIYPISNFIGFGNFEELFTDPTFWMAFGNTVKWTAAITVVSILLGLVLALILNQSFVGRGVVRAIWLLPWAIPTIVASLCWKWMYDPTIGVLNYLFLKFGIIEKPLLYITSRSTAMASVVVVAAWKSYPFTMLALLAGLQSIPQELHEAGQVDGASALQRFRYITLPLLMPVIGILTILQFIWNFNHFDIVYQLTQGGPGDATMLLSTYVYMVAFGATRLGYGSAIAVVMLVMLMLFTAIYLRLYKKQGAEVSL